MYISLNIFGISSIPQQTEEEKGERDEQLPKPGFRQRPAVF